MNPLELLGLALKYGPVIIAVFRALEPLLEQTKPMVDRLIKNGVEAPDAWHLAISHMDTTDEERWFEQAMGHAQ